MKAILFHKHGGPEVLEYTDFPAPEPKAGEVLVRLHAASFNGCGTPNISARSL